MYVRGSGINFDIVSQVISTVGQDHYAGNVVVHPDAKPIGVGGYGYQGRVSVKATKSPGARRSASGRALKATCWHAYGRVMVGIFDIYPHAVITTAVERYAGRDDFLSKYERTAEHNIGSVVQPMCIADACDCDSDNIED